MGISLTSIHIYSDSAPENCGFSFRCFSEDWFTCTDDFSDKKPGYAYSAAKEISKTTAAPVLFFQIEDADAVFLCFFIGGKIAARYADDECIANKKISDIPVMVGHGDRCRKQISDILLCADAEMKTAMLEELFGVCLLYLPEFLENPESLRRQKSNTLYQKYSAEEKELTGKAAPYKTELIAEYPGKIFYDVWGAERTKKEHFFLYGYVSEEPSSQKVLTPVYFAGSHLEVTDSETFLTGRVPLPYQDPRFQMKYNTRSVVTFTDGCPDAYIGKSMTIPAGCYPKGFLSSGEFLLEGNNRIFVADSSLKIIAKLSIQGDVADIAGDYILTASGDSFCGYCYESRAKIRIYRITKR